MTRQIWLRYVVVLVIIGAAWGLTQPLSKVAVSTGYRHFGLTFWQLVIGAAFMAALLLIRGKALPMRRDTMQVYVLIALIGTIIPNSVYYRAIAHLPAGVASILLSLIPMIAFPIALALGLERFRLVRFGGLLAGLGGVLLLVLPSASLPDPAMIIWIPFLMISIFCYAFEGNYVARWGTAGLDAIQVLCGASLVGAVLALPLALGSGQFINPLRPWGAPEWAFVASSLIHVIVYSTYVWLVGRAGPVFAVQVSYLVTGFGVGWSMLILGETYSPYIWAALGLVLAGVFLVQPRRQDALASIAPIRDTGP